MCTTVSVKLGAICDAPKCRGDYNGRLPAIFPGKMLELPVAFCLSGHDCRSLSHL